MDGWGTEALLYEGVVVGRAWESVGKDPAWSAGHPELGVPESGVQSARSIDGAKTACHFWVLSKGRLPSPTEASKGSEDEASVENSEMPSLFFGVIGYLIATFAIEPVLQYHRIRHQEPLDGVGRRTRPCASGGCEPAITPPSAVETARKWTIWGMRPDASRTAISSPRGAAHHRRGPARGRFRAGGAARRDGDPFRVHGVR